MLRIVMFPTHINDLRDRLVCTPGCKVSLTREVPGSNPSSSYFCLFLEIEDPPTMKPKEVNMPNKRKKKLLRKSIKRLRCIRIGKFLKEDRKRFRDPLKDDISGRKWYDLFMCRHPELSERIAETVISVSANVSEEDTKRWFHNFEFCPKENNYFNIYQNPSRVFNGDESNFQLYPKSGKIISLRGERDVYEVDHAAAKTEILHLH
ncbi:hypothetical protein evm_007143 [Chilo suppressalis]|nr:hypothetical protein evm_007143 [Chilo suppressalis]